MKGLETDLQTTIENHKKQRYHKMFDHDNTLCSRFPLLERELKILSVFHLKLFWL